jgi:putative Ca2+/H+ antiporter (TMEM165/GDT1 family)
MKMRSVAVALLLCFAGAVFCLAEDANLGTWKLDEAKSKFSAGAPKTTMSTYEAAGDSVKVTLDGVGFDGKPTHNEWTGKYDGKDYPVTGDSNQTSRAYTMVSDHSMKFMVKNGDKTILSGTIMVAADGKTRTVKAGGMNTAGKKMSYTAVYDKQ